MKLAFCHSQWLHKTTSKQRKKKCKQTRHPKNQKKEVLQQPHNELFKIKQNNQQHVKM